VQDHQKVFLISNSNEGETLDDLNKQGHRLAKEVIDFINDQNLNVDHISFVCHSLGGIVARIAITSSLFDSYREKFFEFITYGTPHLSLINLSHTVLNSFLGIYQTLSKSRCIDQLYLKDSIDPRKSLLYKLSSNKELSHFKHVRLYGFTSDKYAPVGSTLVISDAAVESNQSLTKIKYRQSLPSIPASQYPTNKSPDLIYSEMLEKLSENLGKAESLEKFEVCFKSEQQDYLGRKAHLALVQDPSVVAKELLTNRFHLP
jgi:hypothetical protein